MRSRAAILVVAAVLATGCGLATAGTGPLDEPGGVDSSPGIDVEPGDTRPPPGNDAAQTGRDASPDTESPPPDAPVDSTPLVDTGPIDDAPPADSGTPDSAPIDSGIADTMLADMGTPDTQPADTGMPDTSPIDTGMPDTGMPDTHPPDTGAPDTNPPDTSPPDTGMPDAHEAGAETIAIVQSNRANQSANQVTVTLNSQVRAGDFLAVFATVGDVSDSVTGITDDGSGSGDTFVSANLRSSVNSCQASEIWYARNATGGAQNVTVGLSNGGSVALWVIEASGLASTGGVDDGQTGSGSPTRTVTAPTVGVPVAPDLVVAAIGSCGTLGGIHSGNPFTALTSQNGNNVAYDVATAPGSYGPVFENSNDSWNASVASFH